MWAVYVRRTEVCTVLVKHADPVEARSIALREAADWVEETHAVAYPLEGRPEDRIYVDGEWLYPETSMFEEGQ
mgnify:FL=1